MNSVTSSYLKRVKSVDPKSRNLKEIILVRAGFQIYFRLWYNHWNTHTYVYMCLCVYVCMCVCMWERDTERERIRLTYRFIYSFTHSFFQNHLLRFCFLPVAVLHIGDEDNGIFYHLLCLRRDKYKHNWPESSGAHSTTVGGAQCFPSREGLLWGHGLTQLQWFLCVARTNFILFPGVIIMQIPNFLELEVEF